MDVGVQYTVWVVHSSRILQSAESIMSAWMKMNTSWAYDDYMYVGFVLFSSGYLV